MTPEITDCSETVVTAPDLRLPPVLSDRLGEPTCRWTGQDIQRFRSPIVYALVRGVEVLYIGMSGVGLARPLDGRHPMNRIGFNLKLSIRRPFLTDDEFVEDVCADIERQELKRAARARLAQRELRV